MELNKINEATNPRGYTLQFMVEDQPFTTDQQFLTGAAIKRIAGLPSEAELFLTVSSPWKDELINDDEEVDLARPGLEGFYIKKKLRFTVDGVEKETDRQYLTGLEIKRIGCIPSDFQLFLFIEGPYEDELIEDNTRVNLARPSVENFYAKKLKVNISINDTEYEISRGEHTVVELKKLGSVKLSHELDEIRNHELIPLNDNATVVIKGGEQFVSHVRDGSSS